MRYKPRLVSIKEVTIERDGNYARISFKDASSGTINFGIGPEIKDLSDEDIIAMHNEVVQAQMESATIWRPTEIIDGRPQIKFDRSFEHWAAEGHVLRCMIDSGENDMPVVEIDGHTLSWDEFGKVISPFCGWGMRVMFVGEDQLSNPPQPELRKAPKRIPKKELEELAQREAERARSWTENSR